MGNSDAFRAGRMATAAALCLPTSAVAQLRTSNDYQITTDVLDAGGGTSESDAYRITAGSGGISGIHDTGGLMDRAGFAGQVYDIRGIVFPTSPVLAGEGDTVALAISELWDDGTAFLPTVAGVSWRIATESGAAAISPSGVVETFPVHTDTVVSVVATRYEFSVLLTLIVRNTIEDNFGSYAGDGLPDWWQVTHFGLDNPLAAPHLDPDGDGADNLAEFLALTPPLSAVGRFDVEPYSRPDGHGLRFPTVAGHQYWLEASDTLSDGWSRIDGPLEGNGATRTFALPVETAVTSRFFRVVSER